MKALLVLMGLSFVVHLAVMMRNEAAQPLQTDPLGERYVLATLGEEARVYALAFAPDGRTLWAAGSVENARKEFVVTAWDVKTRRVGREVGCPGASRFSHLALSPTGTRVAAADTDGAVVVLSRDGKTLNTFTIMEGRTSPGHLAFAAKGQVFAVSSTSGVGQRWDIATGRASTYLFRGLKAFALSADAKLAALCSAREVAFHDGSFRRRLGAIALPAGHNIRSLALSHDKTLLMGAADDGLLHLFDVQKKEEVREWQGHDTDIYALIGLPAARAFVTADSVGNVKVWDGGGRLLGHVRYRAAPVCGLAVNPAGTVLATCGEKQPIVLWDLTRLLKGK